MAKTIVNDKKIINIAESLRNQLGVSDTYTIEEMTNLIPKLDTEPRVPVICQRLTITGGESGVSIYTEDGDSLFKRFPNDRSPIHLNKWGKTIVVRKENGYPITANDGVVVFENNVMNKYKDIAYEDILTDKNKKYYYAAFTFDDKLNEGDTVTDIVDTTESLAYGVRFLRHKGRGYRLGMAAGLKSNINGISDFDNMPIYRDIKRVTFDGKNGLPNTGDVMVQIPKFYFKIVEDKHPWNQSYLENPDNDKDLIEFWVSPQKLDGYTLHPAFKVYNGTIDTGLERDFIYVGAYNTTGDENGIPNKSITKKLPIHSKSMLDFQKAARAKGTNWAQNNWMSYGACQMLFTIEHACRRSNDIMYGIWNTGYGERIPVQENGASDKFINLYKNHEIKDVGICWRGIENLYGNVFEWLDGLYTIVHKEPSTGDITINYYISYDVNKFENKLPIYSDTPNANGVYDAIGYDGPEISEGYFKLSYKAPAYNMLASIESLGNDPKHPGALFTDRLGLNTQPKNPTEDHYAYTNLYNVLNYINEKNGGGKQVGFVGSSIYPSQKKNERGLYSYIGGNEINEIRSIVGSRLVYFPEPATKQKEEIK